MSISGDDNGIKDGILSEPASIVLGKFVSDCGRIKLLKRKD